MSEPSHRLHRLLHAGTKEERDEAWGRFLDDHSRLILHAARRASAGHDDTMERYAYVLDRLRENDFRRLRAFSLNGTGKFTTWLVVVVRRLCIDHHRRVFGRLQGSKDDTTDPELVARRNLAGLIADDVDPERAIAHPSAAVDTEVIQEEERGLLAAALAELSPRDQLLLTLRYLDGHSPERVARMLGFTSRFAVRRRLKVVLGGLRQTLEAMGYER